MTRALAMSCCTLAATVLVWNCIVITEAVAASSARPKIIKCTDTRAACEAKGLTWSGNDNTYTLRSPKK